MRVLLFTGMYPYPGNNVNGAAVARQRESLQAIGVEVDLLHARPSGRRHPIRTLFQLRRLAASGRYDLVHAHYGFATTLIALLQPLPLVVTFHGTDINGRPFIHWKKIFGSLKASGSALATRQLSRWISAIIVMTEEMKTRLPLEAQARTQVEPMGVDTDLFYPRPHEESRALLGWGPEPVVVFCSSHGDPVKRPDLAHAAVEEARLCRPDLRLFLLQGVDPSQVPFILSAADCLLVTSDREGSPNIVKESMACNLPVVSVPVGDVPGVLALDPAAGILVPRDPRLLGEALVEVLGRPRPNSPISAVRRYSQENTARRIAAIYEGVLGGRGR
ncbi:MAG: glycosyltransferase family 4 protein [Armatimonadota bacterium]|nr:glycosyltransferase family 4 protein [Armatimonadota bacterium]